MSHISTIITDVGGVLVLTTDHTRRHEWEDTLGIARGQLGKEVFEMQPAELATIGKVSVDVIWDGIQEKFHLIDEQKHQLKKDFYAGDQINTVLYEFFKQLHDHIDMFILSNAWENARDIYTNKYHLDRIVDEMLLSAELGLRKPDPAIFSLALEKLKKTNPQEILFIDDEEPNIHAAKQMGFQTLLFTTTHDCIYALTNTYHIETE